LYRQKREILDMERLLENARLAVRSLRRSPGFVLTASLTLALGIGLATAVFTVAEALLLRRLPVQDQDRIVVLWGKMPGQDLLNYPLGLDDARTFAQSARTLDKTGFYAYEGASPVLVRDGDNGLRLRRALVSGDFFDVLAAQPILGRTLTDADNHRGSAPVIVLSHSVWQRVFSGDPRAIGRRVMVHDQGAMHTIVGVMPQGLDYPRGVDFWSPVIPAVQERNMQYLSLYAIGRLAPNATLASAAEELTAYYQRPATSVWQRNLRGAAHSLPRLILGDTRPALFTFAAASLLLLLITCINVANLLLVRGLSRVREIAVRSALGAKRGRLVGQLLVENGLLAVTGGALGIVVAALAVRGFVMFAPAGVPRVDEIHLNATVLAGAVALTALATLFFALAPAVMTSRVQLQDVLRSDARQTAGRRRRLLNEGLVSAQMALALVVLSATALVMKSLLNLERADLALDPSRLLIAEFAVRDDEFDSTQKLQAALDRLTTSIEAIPGVLGTSQVVSVPFATTAWDGRPGAEGQSRDEAAANPMLNMDVVSPGYFATLGIPVLRGRGFTEADRDGAPLVAVLSQSAAEHYWPGADPIGKRIRMGGNLETAFEVVGVVPDTRYRNLREPRGSVYFPVRQPFFPFAPTTLAIRTSGTPSDLIPTLRRTIEETDPGVALASAAPFEVFLEEPLAQPRLNTFLLAVFACAAVALAAIGLFGVMATMVRQRMREIGVRMALGATRQDVRRMILRRGLIVAGVGLTIGVGGALGLNRLLDALLYEVSPTDAATLGIVAAALLVVATLATALPARASTRIDPVQALRVEG
jgi:predicted permease